MQPNSPAAGDLPEVQTLMAAVIRLMAKCAGAPEVMGIRTLLALIGELRRHPGLTRQPAVLAGLAEAHALWVDRLSQVAIADTCRAMAERQGEDGCKVH